MEKFLIVGLAAIFIAGGFWLIGPIFFWALIVSAIFLAVVKKVS